MKRLAVRWGARVATLAGRVLARPTILYGHGVEARITDPAVQSLHMPAAEFERLMRALQRDHRFVSLDTLMAGGEALTADALCLTMDDGYRNNLTVAEPILSRLGIPFTVYVSTRHIDEGRRFPTYIARVALRYTPKRTLRLKSLNREIELPGRERWREPYGVVMGALKSAPQALVEEITADLMALLPGDQWAELNLRFASDAPMSWNEVAELARRGVDIGAHCHDHCLLHPAQPPEEVKRQIDPSRQRLAEHGIACRHFAFPNGTMDDVSAFAVRHLGEIGFTSATTTVPGTVGASLSPLLLPRLDIRSEPDSMRLHMALARANDRKLKDWQAKLLAD